MISLIQSSIGGGSQISNKSSNFKNSRVLSSANTQGNGKSKFNCPRIFQNLKRREDDYEGIINSLMVEKHFALEPLDYLDLEMDEFDMKTEVLRIERRRRRRNVNSPFSGKRKLSDEESYISNSKEDSIIHFTGRRPSKINENDLELIFNNSQFSIKKEQIK